jgi:hypothetical protein
MKKTNWIPFELLRVGDRIEFLYGRDKKLTTGTIKILNARQECAVVHVSGSSGARPALVGRDDYQRCLISQAKLKERNTMNVPWMKLVHPLIAR